MENKLRQVTDNIHGTIYLSKLESELISTPYFYRLHDIYQSSTVYMTFPSNRTKRYEHSLGTMELSSRMLFSSISNADAETKIELFKHLNGYFSQIFDLAIFQYEDQVAPYFTKNKEMIGNLFEEQEYGANTSEFLEKVVNNDIRKAIANGDFADSALDHFQYYPTLANESFDTNDLQNIFLYRCLLQAVRIVALFHDVGHPPYSHIIETVLNELYAECTSKDSDKEWNKEKLEIFFKCMERYCTKDESKAYSCQTLYSTSSLVGADLHERVGLSFLHSAINDVIPNMIFEILNSYKDKSYKIANILYYIMVVEFSIAMLVEKDIFFKSFHKIIDGNLDADRLDYIMRDSLNSGVDWGRIPYKRLINSAKLVCLMEYEDEKSVEENIRPFVIAYTQKVSDDIEDLLLVRYKIFARINFHHRCMKTAATLQAAVKELAENYLTSTKDTDCISSDISRLWTSLGSKAGDRKLRVILWNDSWLISVLHRALIKLNGQSSVKTRHLREDLEEILLNKKRYYSLLKRGTDNRKFVEKSFEYAGITKEGLKSLLDKELIKYYQHINDEVDDKDILETPKVDALDSIQRIEVLTQIIEKGDIELLFQPAPLYKNTDEVVEEVLRELVEENILADFKMIPNNGRGKTGLPRHKDILDEIYLYKGKNCFTFDEDVSLKSQIKAVDQNIPWLYVYFVPINASMEKNALTDMIFDKIAKEVGKELEERYEELFGKTK